MAGNDTHMVDKPVFAQSSANFSGGVSFRSEIHLVGFPESGKAIAVTGIMTAGHGRS
jgi:hypothetical protein